MNYAIDFELLEISKIHLEFEDRVNNTVKIKKLKNYYMIFYDQKYTYIVNTILSRIICTLEGSYLEIENDYIGFTKIFIKNKNQIYIYDFFNHIVVQEFELGEEHEIYGIHIIDNFLSVRTISDLKIFQIEKKRYR